MSANTRPASELDVAFLESAFLLAGKEMITAARGNWNEARERAQFQEQLVLGSTRIAQENGRDVGFLMLVEGPGVVQIHTLCILPEWQGRGIGSALTRNVIAAGQARGDAVTLQVLKANPRARALYERLGFRITAETQQHQHMRIEGTQHSPMRWLDQFSVILLDMNGTFMFGHDRLGPDEDFFETYRALGGGGLSREQLAHIMSTTCDALLRDYERPECFDDFPTLAEAFLRYGRASEQEVPTLERVFAAHEIGQVPPEHGAFLRRAAKSHQLGVVSNICGSPGPWLELLRANDLFSLFEALVFSSEGRSIKPSFALFERARQLFPRDAAFLFVGDSLARDIIPAKELGWSTAWIAPAMSAHPAADQVVVTLPDLERLTV